MKEEINMNEVTKMAKSVVEEVGEHSPTVLAKSEDGWAMIDLKFKNNDKEFVIESLKQILTELNSEEYYVIFSAWKAESDGQQKMFEKLKSLKGEQLKNYLTEQLKRPSERSNKVEVLTISHCKKHDFTNSRIVEYYKLKDKLIWKNQVDLSGTQTNIWNVWNPHQIDLENN